MADAPAGYIQLLVLAELWARVAGIPSQMVFRRLCEWAACEAFPPGALVDRFETAFQPRDIYFDLEAAMRGDRWSQARLSEILVRASDLPAFCDRTNTILPPPLFSGRIRRWLATRGGKQLVPPACPDAADRYKVRSPPASAEPPAPVEQPITSRREPAKPSTAGRGRPKGSGYEAADEPLIEEMRRAIKADSNLSPPKAAEAVADRARGGGTDDSRAERLARRYREKFGC